MADLPTRKKDDLVDVKFVRSNDFISKYINNARIGVSKWDINLIIGHLETSGDGTPVSIESLFLQMTPAYARALGDDLHTAVKQYEAMYGEVGRPPNEANTVNVKKK